MVYSRLFHFPLPTPPPTPPSTKAMMTLPITYFALDLTTLFWRGWGGEGMTVLTNCLNDYENPDYLSL